MSPAAEVDAKLEEVLVALTRQGLSRAEVYAKRGRARRLELGPGGEIASFHEERGWAVRAGTGRGSFFTAATGEPDPAATWPAIDGPPLELPAAGVADPWSEPSDFETPLVGESEGLRLLAGLARELESELPGARLLAAVLEDGSSEAELASSRGVRARLRGRVAALRLEAAIPARAARAAARAGLYLAAREARRFAPSALARRLADALSVRASGAPPPAESGGELLLAPSVGVRLLAALLPLFVGPEAAARTAPWRDRQGRLGAETLTLVDDGRLPGGVFEAPVDGEGVPCRAVTLVERGVFRAPLLAWWQARGGEGTAAGCSRRASWRDLPVAGPTHLYLQPDPKLAVAALLGGIDRGAYLIEPTGAPRLDLAGGRFSLPVCGFAVAGGRAAAPLAGARLSGTIAELLHGVRAVARDLTFFPFDGMLGVPSLLVHGLDLR